MILRVTWLATTMLVMSDALKSAIKEINKKYGEGTIQKYSEMGKISVKRISSGLPSLDYIIGGGIPEGRIMTVYGAESSGKTTLALKFLAEVQKKYPKKKVAFIDVEHALDTDYARTLGLDMDEVWLSQPDSAEEALEVMGKLVASGELKAVVLDSVAQLTPMKEITGEAGDSEMGGRARLMGQALRKIVPAAGTNECTCIFINQVRTNIGQMYGNPETQPGGRALPFAASIVMRTSFKKIDEHSGQTTIDVKKNKVGKPFQKTTIRIAYGMGYDYVDDLVTTAKMLGVVKQNASIFTYADEKWKGETAMREAITTDEKLQKEIEEVIRNSLYAE